MQEYWRTWRVSAVNFKLDLKRCMESKRFFFLIIKKNLQFNGKIIKTFFFKSWYFYFFSLISTIFMFTTLIKLMLTSGANFCWFDVIEPYVLLWHCCWIFLVDLKMKTSSTPEVHILNFPVLIMLTVLYLLLWLGQFI